MAIVFPIDLPLTYVTELDVEEVQASSYKASQFTGVGRTQEYESEYWRVTITFRQLRRSLAQPVNSFASKLRGPINTFVMPFPGYSAPLGAASLTPSSPVVSGADQAGKTTLTIGSATPSITGWLIEGDIIQVGPSNRPHWHRVLTDVDTDAGGAATIDIWPRLRRDVVNGDAVSFDSPLCVFRKISQNRTNITRPTRHSLTLDCEEAT